MTIIKELRTNKGDTQQDLATMLGITRGAYANIEDGRREPDISTLIRLSDYFNVSVDYLINHERGDLSTFPSPAEWRWDMNEDYDNTKSTEEKMMLLSRWGYDKDHAYDARRYFPWQFSEEKEPTPVSEDGQDFNLVKIAGRDGSRLERRLTDEQIAALKVIIDQLPDATDL